MESVVSDKTELEVMSNILEKLGLTAEMISRHVIATQPNKEPKRWLGKKVDRRTYHRLYMRRKRINFVKQGLTTKGTPRIAKVGLTRSARLKYFRDYDQNRREKYLAQGLTVKGLPRQRPSKYVRNFKNQTWTP